MELVKHLQVTRINRGVPESVEDEVIREAPLTIYYNENELVTLLCTPDKQDELALGFLFSEGLIKDPDEITLLKFDAEKGLIWVETSKTETIAQKLFLKRYITTGCGMGTTFFNIMDSALVKKTAEGFTMPAEDLFSLMKKVQESSVLYKATGGVHGAALGQAGELVCFREDVGRHNAVDKLFGRCFLDRVDLADKVLLTSGRLSSEILLKVAKRGIGVLVSRSAPTDLAVKLATELGITIVGFVRGIRMNIYSSPERIILPKE